MLGRAGFEIREAKYSGGFFAQYLLEVSEGRTPA
jgi:hypothetical protein